MNAREQAAKFSFPGHSCLLEIELLLKWPVAYLACLLVHKTASIMRKISTDKNLESNMNMVVPSGRRGA